MPMAIIYYMKIIISYGKQKSILAMLCVSNRYTVTWATWLRFDHRFTPKAGRPEFQVSAFKLSLYFISPDHQLLPTALHLSLRLWNSHSLQPAPYLLEFLEDNGVTEWLDILKRIHKTPKSQMLSALSGAQPFIFFRVVPKHSNFSLYDPYFWRVI